MVTVIFVVCLGIVFTALQRINNCHKKTSSLAVLPGPDGEAERWRLGRKAWVHQGTISCVGMLGQDKQLLFNSFGSFSESGKMHCICCRHRLAPSSEIVSVHTDFFFLINPEPETRLFHVPTGGSRV